MTPQRIGAAVLVVALVAVVFAAGVVKGRGDSDLHSAKEAARTLGFLQPEWKQVQTLGGKGGPQWFPLRLPSDATAWRVVVRKGSPTVRNQSAGFEDGDALDPEGWRVTGGPPIFLAITAAGPWEVAVEVGK